MLMSNIDSFGKRFFAIVIIALLYIACNGDPTDAPVDIREIRTTKQKGKSLVEGINNCGGPERVKVSREVSYTLYAETQIEVITGVDIDFDVDIAEVKSRLELRYKYVNGSSKTVTSRIELAVPPYTYVEYTIQPQETWVWGEIYNTKTKEALAKYKIRGDTSDLTIIGSKTKDCDNNKN